jgi:L-rhamnonate dehydratase
VPQLPHIAQVRASVVSAGASDYFDRGERHWLDGPIATPMARYPGFTTGRSFGLDAYRTFVVEVEAASGEIGVGISSGGVPACWIVEHQLARLVEGREPAALDELWDLMWRATLFYGRKGLVLNAISAVDLALWDLAGKLRQEPVHELIGGAVRDELELYATGPRPDLARELGFSGGKLSLPHGLAEGDEGFRRNVELALELRSLAGADFLLACDCWMAFDLDYSLRLAEALAPHGIAWLEECLQPDDYWGYAELRRRAPPELAITTGEHEASRYGFRLLVDMGCCDVIQPDIRWCGGLSELLVIAAYADAQGIAVNPHVSGVYGYHFAVTRPPGLPAEFLIGSPDAASVVPYFGSILVDEPLAENGRLQLAQLDRPGFGVELNPKTTLERPFPR